MIQSIKALFEKYQPEIPQSPFTEIELASAALLIEVALADGDFSPIERDSLSQLLQNQFHIPQDILEGLINTAENELEHSIDHYQFTKHITDQFNYPQRCKLIAAMWTVAFADNSLDQMEEHRIRRISELICLDHSDFIRLKLEAREQAEKSNS